MEASRAPDHSCHCRMVATIAAHTRTPFRLPDRPNVSSGSPTPRTLAVAGVWRERHSHIHAPDTGNLQGHNIAGGHRTHIRGAREDYITWIQSHDRGCEGNQLRRASRQIAEVALAPKLAVYAKLVREL